MKKIISIFLAIVMCFTMTTVAFAEEAKTETEVSKDSIMSVLLEAAKVASDLNDEARKKLSDELEKILIGQIAGDSVILQKAAQWILDKALELSGSDSLLTLDKKQAEEIAEMLTKMYDGNLGEYIDNPFVSFIIKFIPEDVMKEAVVWLLSDGFGNSLKDFIDKYGDGETSPEDKPETEKPEEEEPADPFDVNFVVLIQAAIQAVTDVVNELVAQFKAILGEAQGQPQA